MQWSWSCARATGIPCIPDQRADVDFYEVEVVEVEGAEPDAEDQEEQDSEGEREVDGEGVAVEGVEGRLFGGHVCF